MTTSAYKYQDWMHAPCTMKQIRRLRELRIPPRCPKCGSTASVEDTAFGVQHQCCGLRSRNWKPLVTESTLAARVSAHDAFDRLWRSGHMTRDDAYNELSKSLGIPRKRCHMSMLLEDDCLRVVEWATAKLEVLEN